MDTLTNRGTGAGGANTNVTGGAFEYRTSNEPRLLANGFVRTQIEDCNGKEAYYLTKENTVFVTQNGLKRYVDKTFGIRVCRKPDEAYIRKVGDTYVLKILEKKNQNVEGSVADKLGLGPYFVSEYSDCLGDKFRVEYAFCLSEFLKKEYVSDAQKFKHLRKYNEQHSIKVFFGDDPDYFTKLDAWIYS
jgi:hypothetical protein